MLGATTEVGTLKEALSEAEDKAAKERTEREKQEAQVGEVQQELQDFVKNMSPWSVTLRHKGLSLRRPLRTQKCQGRSPQGPPGASGGTEDSGG